MQPNLKPKVPLIEIRNILAFGYRSRDVHSLGHNNHGVKTSIFYNTSRVVQIWLKRVTQEHLEKG